MNSIQKYGGPHETNNINEWNQGITKNNKTWKVIDCGHKLVAIWEVLHRMDPKDTE